MKNTCYYKNVFVVVLVTKGAIGLSENEELEGYTSYEISCVKGFIPKKGMKVRVNKLVCGWEIESLEPEPEPTKKSSFLRKIFMK